MRTYLRGDAREERAKAEAGKARILHFASHGVVDPDVPFDSFLALTIPALDEKADDNGILQAWEILQSRLDADLVVLSACVTAFGPERGVDRPAWTEIRRELGISRKRLPQLYARLGEMVRQCRDKLGGPAKAAYEKEIDRQDPDTRSDSVSPDSVSPNRRTSSASPGAPLGS